MTEFLFACVALDTDISNLVVGFPEIYPLVQYFQALGFPELPESAWPDCGVIGLRPGCTKQRKYTQPASTFLQ